MLWRQIAKAFIGAAVLSLVLGVPAAEAKDPKDIRIAYSAPQLANPWFRGVKAGMDKACAELGIQCVAVDAQNSKTKQGEDIRKMITDGYDAIFATALDPYNLSQLFSLAKSFGIVTGSIAQTAINSNLIYGMDEFAYDKAIGTQAANWAKKNLKCKGKVALLTQDNIATVRARGDGVVKAIRTICPELQIVARFHADDPFRGMSIMEIVIPRHPDLDMVVATTDSGGIGGYIIMTANGLVGDKHAVFSGDATPDAITLMKEPNSIYRGTVDLSPVHGGYESIRILYNMIQYGAPKSPVVRQLPYVEVSQEKVRSEDFKFANQ